MEITARKCFKDLLLFKDSVFQGTNIWAINMIKIRITLPRQKYKK